ncbi:hypothetical protein ANTPLA_LOCUS8211 [Anthophora plagiata]
MLFLQNFNFVSYHKYISSIASSKLLVETDARSSTIVSGEEHKEGDPDVCGIRSLPTYNVSQQSIKLLRVFSRSGIYFHLWVILVLRILRSLF